MVIMLVQHNGEKNRMIKTIDGLWKQVIHITERDYDGNIEVWVEDLWSTCAIHLSPNGQRDLYNYLGTLLGEQTDEL